MASGRPFLAVLPALATAALGAFPAYAHPVPPGPAVEPAQHRSGMITSGDYPASALRDQAHGTSVLRHLVGADGRVLRCEVIRSSGNSALDAAACSLSHRRIRYRPARDAAGNNVEQWRTFQHRWVLPEAARADSGPKPASD